MSQEQFTFRDGERVIRFGAGVLAETADLLAANGFEGGWVLLTTERARAQVPQVLLDSAADELHVAAGPVPEAAAALLDGAGGRDLVAFGGGRVVDVAKALAAAGGGRVAAIPTTLAGSTFTPFHRMPAGHDGYGGLRPALAVCDPALMASAPREVLTATAMNALAHAVESLYAPFANPVTEGAALRAAPLIVRALEADEPDGSSLSLGGLLGGYAVGVAAGLCVHHATCQTLVGVAGTPHAQTNAVMLPRSMAFMAPRAPGALGRLAEALGEGSIDAAIERVAAVAAGAGPTTLAELGLDASALDPVLDALLEHPGIGWTPGDVERADLRALLESAEPG